MTNTKELIAEYKELRNKENKTLAETSHMSGLATLVLPADWKKDQRKREKELKNQIGWDRQARKEMTKEEKRAQNEQLNQLIFQAEDEAIEEKLNK